jgi:hypothetical protein
MAPGASPTRPLNLTPVGLDRQADALAVAPDGSALVVLSGEIITHDHSLLVQGAFRPRGARFGSPEDISGPQDGPQDFRESPAAAVAAGGRALAAWVASDHTASGGDRLHVSERDATPPAFKTVSVPARAAVGQRVSLAATATDALSLPKVTWSFGDGSQATGTRVSHVFGTPGAHTVTITATDSVGNRGTQTRAIAVARAGGDDHTRPVIERLSASHTRFRIGGRATSVLARAAPRRIPAGTVFALVLSERASVAVVFRRGRTVTGVLVRSTVGPDAARIAFSGRLVPTSRGAVRSHTPWPI